MVDIEKRISCFLSFTFLVVESVFCRDAALDLELISCGLDSVGRTLETSLISGLLCPCTCPVIKKKKKD